MNDTAYYHISSVDAVAKIKKHGLRLDEDGKLYVLDAVEITVDNLTIDIAAALATNQLFLDEFAVWEIQPVAITAEPEPDDVGEAWSQHQFIISHPISPQHVTLMGTYTIKNNAHAVWNLLPQHIKDQMPQNIKDKFGV